MASRELAYTVTPKGCWECTSHKQNQDGYPVIARNGKSYVASRFVYIQNHGEIPANQVVRHKCDNRKCINPDHLELGTQQENVKDISERRRWSDRSGSKNSQAKLNESLIPEVIRRLRNFEKQKDIAKDLGVSQQIISRIKCGDAWKCVERVSL